MFQTLIIPVQAVPVILLDILEIATADIETLICNSNYATTSLSKPLKTVDVLR
jgi:hypothetical protein